MTSSSHLRRREWGATPIRGGRHAFRINLLARKIISRLSRPASILDAGCGDGCLSLLLWEYGFSVTALDAAVGGLLRFQQEAGARLFRREQPSGKPECVSGSLGSLPFADESFDAVAAGEVLEHLDDDHRAVEEFYRVLKPGGLSFITVPAHPRLFGLEDEWAGHKRRYTLSDLCELFLSRGFTPLELHYWGWPFTWLYNRLLYPHWLRRQLKKGNPNPDPLTSPASHHLLMKAMFYLLSLDRLFLRIPAGIGLIAVFQKPAIKTTSQPGKPSADARCRA